MVANAIPIQFPSRQIDKLCVDTIRTLSMDAVQSAVSGHPSGHHRSAWKSSWCDGDQIMEIRSTCSSLAPRLEVARLLPVERRAALRSLSSNIGRVAGAAAMAYERDGGLPPMCSTTTLISFAAGSVSSRCIGLPSTRSAITWIALTSPANAFQIRACASFWAISSSVSDRGLLVHGGASRK